MSVKTRVAQFHAQGGDESTFEFMADKFASVHTEINLMAGSVNEVQYV